MASPDLDSKQLTTNYADSRFQKSIKDSDETHLTIDYQKGDESSAEMLVEYSTTKDDDGSEVWAQTTLQDEDALSDFIVLKNQEFQMQESGVYRVPLPNSLKEDQLRVSFKRTSGTDASAGTVTVFAVNSRLSG